MPAPRLLRYSLMTPACATTAALPPAASTPSTAAEKRESALSSGSAPGMGRYFSIPRRAYSSGQRARISSKVSPSHSPAYCSVSPSSTSGPLPSGAAVCTALESGLEYTASTLSLSSNPSIAAWSLPRAPSGRSVLPRHMRAPPGKSGFPWRMRYMLGISSLPRLCGFYLRMRVVFNSKLEL